MRAIQTKIPISEFKDKWADTDAGMPENQSLTKRNERVGIEGESKRSENPAGEKTFDWIPESSKQHEGGYGRYLSAYDDLLDR